MKRLLTPNVAIALAAGMTVVAVGWFLVSGAPTPAPSSKADVEVMATTHETVPTRRANSRAPKRTLDRPGARRAPSRPLTEAPSEPSASEALLSVADLERQFHATSDTEARVAVAAEIAGHNDAVAVGAIGRLFSMERHPTVKMELLSSLADIDASEAPELRFQTLAAALHRQPRDIRITALDLLNELDDPRAAALLKKATTDDPDKEVRETASELFRDRTEENSATR